MHKITRRGYNQCLSEIYIIRQKITQVIIRIREARKNGDFSENAELHSELKTKKYLDIKLTKLIEIISSWDVIDMTDIIDLTVVQIGATISLLVGRSICKYTIVGEYEYDVSQNKISYKSPFAQALIGKRDYDDIMYQGKKYTVREINYEDIF